MKLYIKNMACERCRKIVTEELEKNNLHVTSVNLGEVEIKEEMSPLFFQKIKFVLYQSGFHLLDENESSELKYYIMIIDKLVCGQNKGINDDYYLSYICSHTGKSKDYIRRLFAQVKGISVEKYISNKKIDRIKELLVFENKSLAEITELLHFKSISQLTNIFKGNTGFTPSRYLELKSRRQTIMN